MRFCMPSESNPGSERPDTSPFTSAKNTGTPISEKLSASTFMVTVLPVPVAPVMRPWRLAILGSKNSFSPWALAAYTLLSKNINKPS